MTAALLAFLLVASPMNAGTVDSGPRTTGSGAGSCTSYSWKVPPSHIRVLRAHHKGSSARKRVETWSMDRYVAAVMASGAWPNRVWESAKVGALAIRQYATWTVLHTCRTWKGHRYDISDSEQYLRPSVRPRSLLPVRTLRAVRLMAGVSLTKHGRHIRTGWSGGTCSDGWHLCEDTVRGLAQRGLGWRGIVRRLLVPVRIQQTGMTEVADVLELYEAPAWLRHHHKWQPGPYIEAGFSVPTSERSRRMVTPPSIVLVCECGEVRRVRVPDRVKADVGP